MVHGLSVAFVGVVSAVLRQTSGSLEFDSTFVVVNKQLFPTVFVTVLAVTDVTTAVLAAIDEEVVISGTPEILLVAGSKTFADVVIIIARRVLSTVLAGENSNLVTQQ